MDRSHEASCWFLSKFEDIFIYFLLQLGWSVLLCLDFGIGVCLGEFVIDTKTHAGMSSGEVVNMLLYMYVFFYT